MYNQEKCFVCVFHLLLFYLKAYRITKSMQLCEFGRSLWIETYITLGFVVAKWLIVVRDSLDIEFPKKICMFFSDIWSML